MTSRCTPPKKTIFRSCDLEKDQRSKLSMWTNFPTPKVLQLPNMVKKLPIIWEILKEDHNAAAVRKLKRKQIGTLSGMLKNVQEVEILGKKPLNLKILQTFIPYCCRFEDFCGNF